MQVAYLHAPSALFMGYHHSRQHHRSCKHWVASGAGEGNRTLVCSLEGCRSTIELRPHLLRIIGFRLVYGDTVGQIRDRIRMEHALELLRSSRMSVVEIALESGYHSPASFTRAFKASFGISPGRMRREGFQSQMLGKLARRDG